MKKKHYKYPNTRRYVTREKPMERVLLSGVTCKKPMEKYYWAVYKLHAS